MCDSDRPRFDLNLETHIEAVHTQADLMLWSQLEQLLVATPAKIQKLRIQFPMRRHGPPQPKRPMLVRTALTGYAHTIYIGEGNQYPADPKLRVWLQNLTKRVTERAMKIVEEVEDAGKANQLTLLEHGISKAEMRKAIFDEMESLIESRMTPAPTKPPLPPEIQEQLDAEPQNDDDPSTWSPLHQRIAALKALNEIYQGPRETIHESLVRTVLAEQYGVKPEEVTWKQIQFEVSGLLRYYPAIELIPSTPVAPPTEANPVANDTELQRRAKLLEDYKAATGNPSSKKIYEARNSGVHKPEFYRWLRGQLPSGSSTAQAFERFLRDKRPPIPRKPKP